jgi:hypothetical protein
MKKEQPDATEETMATDMVASGVFVVMADNGFFWDGMRWVKDFAKALRFGEERHFPYGPCKTMSDEARRLTGVRCSPTYIPLPIPPIPRLERRTFPAAA